MPQTRRKRSDGWVGSALADQCQPVGHRQDDGVDTGVGGDLVVERTDGDGVGVVDVLVDGKGTTRAAIIDFGGFLGGALAPVLTGYIAQAWSFVPALLTGAGIAFAGALAYHFLVVEPIPEQD